ncbi:class I glutamine amidotransferase-like protein [Xylariaceae sp. FL0662B]|nr:class I glutamine amidotransferase-like protein [Xylariaceae sp. FL0662B]
MSKPLNLAKPDRTVHVGVILLNSTTEILDVAPIDFIYRLSHAAVDVLPDELCPPHFKAQAIDLQFHWVSENGPVTNSQLTSTISLTPTDSFKTCPPLDIVLMGAEKPGYVANEAELTFVRKCWEDCQAFITICAGLLTPLRAGILEGKTATAPRILLESLRRQAPGTNWVEKRWVRDGKLWSSGALLNGLDLMANFVAEFWGGEGTLAEFAAKFGAWPDRDIDYKDVSWKI